MIIEQSLYHFLDEHYDDRFPVLLGLSGGPDSLALFYLLEGYKHRKSLRFAVAHIDHGWRSESAEEAKTLEVLAENKIVPFHLKKLNLDNMSGNLEEACRHERLAFFTYLCKEHGYQAVILGHHADDLSETVLKRVLEGNSLPFLYGMSSISSYQGLTLWRPLLNCSKSDIKSWLQQEGYTPFEDRTNTDNKFLRGRFRTKIIPELSRDFGKEIGSSLCRIGAEAEELKAYLDTKLENYLKGIVQGPFGAYLDLSESSSSWDFEIKYLIRKTCEKEGIRISHHLIDEACQLLQNKKADCQLESYLYVDRGRFFVLKQNLVDFKYKIHLNLGDYFIGNWMINVSEVGEIDPTLSGWKEAWKGNLQVQVPEGNYILSSGDSSLSKWWTNAKVPALMRWIFPVLWSDNGIFHEFLTTRRLFPYEVQRQKQWLISLFYSHSN